MLTADAANRAVPMIRYVCILSGEQMMYIRKFGVEPPNVPLVLKRETKTEPSQVAM